MLQEDRRLRDRGHPQSHIYNFRSASITYDTMMHLPVPWYDVHGNVPDTYWEILLEYGVPASAFPSRMSQRSPSLSAREQELRSFASQASRVFSGTSAPGVPSPPATVPHLSTFAARFGSPVRRLNYSIPQSPMRPSASSASQPSPSTAELLHRAATAPIRTPGTRQTGSDFLSLRETPGMSPFDRSPLPGQPEAQIPSDTKFCDHIDFAVSVSTWNRIRTSSIAG